MKDLKIAIVVEELTQLGGAERILDAMIEIFPDAPIFTLVWDKEKTQHRYDKRDIRTSFIQRMPLGIKKYKWYLPLMPKAVESLNLKGFDLIFSITSALVKGVKTTKNQLHICYCNTPTRYLWTDPDYVKTAPIPFFIRPFMPIVLSNLKKWDLVAAKRPDYFIGNSKNIQARIKKFYHRDSYVIFPNVETHKFSHLKVKKADYFLLVSRIEPYKKVNLVLDAFRQLKAHNLVIVGAGSGAGELNKKCPKNIKFLGRLSDAELANTYAKAKAFIFPQEEDFGITPVEAMAAGTPVIAYRKGGALETVAEGRTGEFFFPQTAEALVKVIENFQAQKYRPDQLAKQAAKFDIEVFKRDILEYTLDRIKSKFKKK